MERDETGKRRSLQPSTTKHDFAILAQFLQAVESMEHIDDIFLWLANTMVRQLSIDALQIWTAQVAYSQQTVQTLRAIALLDRTTPKYVVLNGTIAEIAGTIARKQLNITTRAVDDIFSLHNVSLLKRYGLYYYASCFLSGDTSIPAPKSQMLMAPSKVPSTIVTLVFLKQTGSQYLLQTINLILEQALVIAESRGLLSIPSAGDSSSLISTPQAALPALYDLIPRRMRSNTSMRSSSPFSSTVSISNKIALTFYGAIDGHRTIVEIAATKKMRAKEITEAVQLLLQEKRIQLYTKEGQLVDSEVLLRSI